MKHLSEQIIEQILSKKAFIKDYPKKGVIFLTIDSLFNDPKSRKTLTEAVTAALDPQSFDAIAGIASRGYLFSGMIASVFNKGEYLVQKVKIEGDSHYVQLDTTTEYSSDALQVLKNSIQPAKKYLLTDDLIATGGSALTAIKLIRQCGGKVDTLFVMTELTDFKANEALEKEGVKLVSLLKFTEQDLQKCLVIQESYSEKSKVPMTYSLTNHMLHAEPLKEAIEASSTKVHLASESIVKKEAVALAFQGMFDPIDTQVITHQSQSRVSEQPYNYDETQLGAANRLKFIEDEVDDLDKEVMVSIENGLRYAEEENCYYDFVTVIVKRGDKSFIHTQDCCMVPEEVINSIRKDEQGHFVETWGQAALRMGLVKNIADPHQEIGFGGVSRKVHLTKAICQALGLLKSDLMPHSQDQTFTLNKMIELNKSKVKKQAKQGLFFAAQEQPNSEAAINLYNQGCPVQQWNIEPEQLAHNSFKVFTTGDAFSVISPKVELNGESVVIHIGLEHAQYSPLVLLQEALQLSRCAYEQGAKSITVALPESLHPVLNYNDFNRLLMRLFKASGVNNLYFYDKKYSGKLEKKSLQEMTTLVLSDHSDKGNYTIDREDLKNYLQQDQATLESRVRGITRQNNFKRTLGKFNANGLELFDSLELNQEVTPSIIPALRVKTHVVISCSANKPFAEQVAASLREKGENVKFYEIDGEGEKAKIPEDAQICGAVVTLVQSTRPNPDCTEKSRKYAMNGSSSYFFEAMMIASQANLRGAETINLINPYQFNARSDKAENNPKGKTGSYVQLNGLLLEASGINNVVTAECHDNHTLSGAYTSKKMRGSAVSGLAVISAKLAHEWINNHDNEMQGQLRLVNPDDGAAKRTKELTEILQAIIGEKLCQARVLGEKKRDSHKDDSALISNLNSGNVGINAQDKYLITDDETATGNTLCQAITNLTRQGAKNISVIIVHNNMPLDWMTRQLCLARFFYLGASDLHFSDTQEMGTRATSYEDLLNSCAQKYQTSRIEIEKQVQAWFKENSGKALANQSEEDVNSEFTQFKQMFDLLPSKVRVHSLVDDFVNKLATKPVMDKQLSTNLGLTLFGSQSVVSNENKIHSPSC